MSTIFINVALKWNVILWKTAYIPKCVLNPYTAIISTVPNECRRSVLRYSLLHWNKLSELRWFFLANNIEYWAFMSVFRVGCDNRIAQDRAVYLDVLRFAAKRPCEQLAVPEVCHCCRKVSACWKTAYYYLVRVNVKFLRIISNILDSRCTFQSVSRKFFLDAWVS